MSKKLYSCYIKESSQSKICKAGGGGFSAGIEYCAKHFARYAKGSDNFSAASKHIKDLIESGGDDGINLSEIYCFWFNNGYHLQNLLCCLSQLFDYECITINSEMQILRTNEPWID